MQAEPFDTRALIDAATARTADAEPLARLHAATGAADATVDHFAAAAREDGSSRTQIGAQLGVTRQAARQRYALRALLTQEGARGELPVEPRLAASLEAAHAAAAEQDSVPGTQRLPLGLPHAGAAANALDRLGATREKAREAGARLFAPVDVGGRRTIGDRQAEQATAGARRLAADRGQRRVRGEHVPFVTALDPGSSAGAAGPVASTQPVLGVLRASPSQFEWSKPASPRSVPRRYFPIDPTAHGDGGLPISQVLGELQHAHQRQDRGREPAAPIGREPPLEILVPKQTIESIPDPHRRCALRAT